MDFDLASPPSVNALESCWRAFEAEVPRLSFFQSWSWVGCLAEERFPDPVLLRVSEHGRLRAMALFNRRRGRLYLGASGEPTLDSPWVEHNAPLLSPGSRPGLMQAVWRLPGVRRLVLPGVPAAVVAAAGGIPLRIQVQPAPRVDLELVRAAGGDHVTTLSANTRYQIRRALRAEAKHGPLRLARAATVAEALSWLEALVSAHQADWQRRGHPGAFVGDFTRRFHAELIARSLPRNEIDLLRVTAGDKPVGHLYNFRLGGEVLAYQSGLSACDWAHPHAKPGLVCHILAIGQALADGAVSYDFLAGEARYKRSLSNAETHLAWAELVPAWSPLGLLVRLRQAASVFRSGSKALSLISC